MRSSFLDDAIILSSKGYLSICGYKFCFLSVKYLTDLSDEKSELIPTEVWKLKHIAYKYLKV